MTTYPIEIEISGSPRRPNGMALLPNGGKTCVRWQHEIDHSLYDTLAAKEGKIVELWMDTRFADLDAELQHLIRWATGPLAGPVLGDDTEPVQLVTLKASVFIKFRVLHAIYQDGTSTTWPQLVAKNGPRAAVFYNSLNYDHMLCKIC